MYSICSGASGAELPWAGSSHSSWPCHRGRGGCDTWVPVDWGSQAPQAPTSPCVPQPPWAPVWWQADTLQHWLQHWLQHCIQDRNKPMWSTLVINELFQPKDNTIRHYWPSLQRNLPLHRVQWFQIHRHQCKKLGKIFTGPTSKLHLSYMVISYVYKSFGPNKTTFNKYCLNQWISKLPLSFEIHW